LKGHEIRMEKVRVDVEEVSPSSTVLKPQKAVMKIP
jgi:hypothetical protein